MPIQRQPSKPEAGNVRRKRKSDKNVSQEQGGDKDAKVKQDNGKDAKLEHDSGEDVKLQETRATRRSVSFRGSKGTKPAKPRSKTLLLEQSNKTEELKQD